MNIDLMFNKLKNVYQEISENALIWVFTGLSILVSARVIYIQHGWINDDSVLYFEAAKLFANGAWKEGLALYNWPLYSALIAGLHNIISLDIQTSAQILDVFFFAITTFSFLGLVRVAGGDKTTISSGALLLFSSGYIVGAVLPMLLRDQGFWAFFLTSLIFFIRFYRAGRLSDGLIWQVCIVIAMLFRIEAITYLLLMPFILLGNQALTVNTRILRIAQAHVITLISVILIIIAFAYLPSMKLANLGRLQEAIMLNHGQIIHDLITKANMLGEMVLGNGLSDYAWEGLVISLVLILIIKSVEAGGWLCTALIGFTYKSATHKPNEDVKLILYWTFALTLLNISVIILRTYVLSGRYVIPIGFIIMIIASFSLASLWGARSDASKPSQIKMKWISTIFLILLSLSLLKNIAPKRIGHNYTQDAVAWVKSNVSPDSSVFYDSPRLRYYAGLPLTVRGIKPWDMVTKAINDKSINQYDYLVIHISRRNPEREGYLIKMLNQQIITKFRSDNGDSISIFSKPEGF